MILFPQTYMKKIIDGVRQQLCRDYFLFTDTSMETKESGDQACFVMSAVAILPGLMIEFLTL